MKENKPQSTSKNNPSFQKKVWIVVGILAFSIITILLLKATFRVFLLILAGALIAIFFRGLSSFIQKKTKWKEGICVAISIISTFLIVIGLFWLIGAKVQDQMAELVETLPKTVENAKAKLNESSIGRNIVDNFSSVDSIEKAQGFAGQFFQSTFGFFGDLYVVLFIGIFFTISPKIYINGLVQLIPIKGQEAGKQVLNNISNQLLNWLKGTFFSMFVVFVLTAIGLAIIGIPLWLVLALLAGLISFIPNFGPLIALIPAVLIGLLQSPETALLVVGLYILIQFIESNFITTLVQKKLLDLPPALIIIAQLIMGTLTGIWGLVLATPIIVILIVLVQDLYIKNRE
ncbi:conserved hypothetical membrane protein (UPF0118) [Formosa agariphila KMM 3901]|uniref:Conserved hypothetical membrane protein (UPF0118) n=1 Tax=Formosa agariphila (strain DSM 15362 / KCTC 12365 / LMG 23005 / KMM 3901 / M-2Alg 35-1) TaxID=1347342 RepID=T2KJN4_FORAG|nr:AI-2E family transporter [Formosa agariphila]CDF78631.1 conserved hypothetical membrane protein (UPF0118) [Formosa agariphila KMM 3901]